MYLFLHYPISEANIYIFQLFSKQKNCDWQVIKLATTPDTTTSMDGGGNLRINETIPLFNQVTDSRVRFHQLYCIVFLLLNVLLLFNNKSFCDVVFFEVFLKFSDF